MAFYMIPGNWLLQMENVASSVDLCTQRYHQRVIVSAPWPQASQHSLFVQAFGLETGLPFTAYRKSYKARARIVARLESAIADMLQGSAAACDGNKGRGRANSVVTTLLEGLKEQGIDVFGKDGSNVANTLANEATFLLFAGALPPAAAFASPALLQS
jgi:hypothetical protein